MVNLVQRLCQPWFLYRPRQLALSLWRKLRPFPSRAQISLPWGDELVISPTEAIGQVVWMHGIHDLHVCEAIFRLAEPGSVMVDVGANIGVTASAMAHATGAGGKVVAFEPHPDLVGELRSNVARWDERHSAAVEVRPKAIGDRIGEARLSPGRHFGRNHGLAHVLRAGEQSDDAITVALSSLDEELPDPSIGLCKIDTEGFEDQVISGAHRLLEARRIVNLVFEDRDSPDTTPKAQLLDHGMTIFRIDSQLRGPRLIPLERATPGPEPLADFLATREPVRALKRFDRSGWRALGRARGR